MASEDQELVKYGKPLPYERNFKGPLWRRRGCTDVPCLLIFLLFLAGWVFVAYFAVKNGDLAKFMTPTDSLNRKCGVDSTVLNKKYLFFFNLEKCIDPFVPLTGCPTPQVCVEKCPSERFIWDEVKQQQSFDQIMRNLICLTDADKNSLQNKQQIETAIKNNKCAGYYIKSAPFLNRCMWEFSPQVCELIPNVLLETQRKSSRLEQWRGRRDLQSRYNYNETEGAGVVKRSPANNAVAKLDVQEDQVQCRRRTELGEAVIKEKMRQTDTRLAKFVGNIVAHFYNGTHDAQQIGEAVVEDIINSWYVIVAALICTLVASLIFIALMRWLAAPFLWFSILGVLTGLAVGIYYSIRQYIFWKNTHTVPNHSPNIHSAVKNLLQDKDIWLYLSIFEVVCFVVILLLVIVLRKRISIAIALTKEGSKAVSSVISTVFFPIFSWVLFILAIAYAIAVGLYLGSIGDPQFKMIRQLDPENGLETQENCICTGAAGAYKVGDSCSPDVFEQNCYVQSSAGFFQSLSRTSCVQTSCSFVQIQHPTIVVWFIVYNVFGFLWITAFISAFSDMVLACTFACWYWTFKKRDVPYFTLTKAFFQTAFYHLGTLAFGSLILAICRLIVIVLEYIDSKLKKYDNAVTRAIMCCMKCFFYLLENFLRFLNRNAYIMCAIHGKGFCSSAHDAFNLVMRNFLRVVTLDKVTDFLFFLSKVLITGAAGVATYYFVAHNSFIHLNYNIVPTVIVVIAAFLITSVFFGVYSMAVDTLFLCFLEDCERNDGTPEKPYYMSKQLMSILGKRNKRIQRQRQLSNESR